MKPIKLILADDHQLFRDGIKSLLEDIADIQVIGEASNGAELLKMLPSLEPQSVILDITMPDISGIEITKTIQND